MTQEAWRTIAGHETYKISDLGRVSSGGRILTTTLNPKGFEVVSLISDRSRPHLIHRLVAEAFLGPSNHVVTHIDGDKRNNTLLNLKYTTRSEHAKKDDFTGITDQNSGYFGYVIIWRGIHDTIAQAREAIYFDAVVFDKWHSCRCYRKTAGGRYAASLTIRTPTVRKRSDAVKLRNQLIKNYDLRISLNEETET